MKTKKFIDPEYFYIYAETAFIHEGDEDYMAALIDDVKRSGADGIKFQILLDIESTYDPDLPIYDKLGDWIFGAETWIKIIGKAREAGLDVIVLPIDMVAARFCTANSDIIDSVEIHPICFNDYFLLQEISNMNKTIILGIGGRETEEIDFALDILKTEEIVLMYGFQAFPTDTSALRLARIKELKKRYGFVMGYADHTSYDDPSANYQVELAYRMGARVFEKHIALEPGVERVDYESSTGHREIRALRARLNNATPGVPDTPRQSGMSLAEKKYGTREKQLVFRHDMEAGREISFDDVSYMVTEKRSDFEQREIVDIVGHNVTMDIKARTPVLKAHINGVA